jgi:hypothetical protein
MGTMSSDAIAQLLVEVLFGATVLFVARLLWVRFHDRYPLFVLWNALSVVFLFPQLFPQLSPVSVGSSDMISWVMDLFLLPFVAVELFRPAPEPEPLSARQIAPPIAGLVAGGFLAAYLSTGLDTESFGGTYLMLLMMDTVIFLVIAAYLMRKFREGTPPGESNVTWMRRLFFLEIVLGVVGTLVYISIQNEAAGKLMRVGSLALDLIIPVASLIVLRKPKPEGAPAA